MIQFLLAQLGKIKAAISSVTSELATVTSDITFETQTNYSLLTSGVENKIIQTGNVVNISMVVKCDANYNTFPGILVINNIPKNATNGNVFFTIGTNWNSYDSESNFEPIRIAISNDGKLYIRGGEAGKYYDVNISYITK